MKPKLLLLFSLMLLLTACNLPMEGRPTADVVATQVAKILTQTGSAPSAEAPTPTQPLPPEESTLIEPSQMITPEEPTFTPTEVPTDTPVPTETFTPTLTFTPLPSPTPDQSDPAVRFGNPKWTDDFSSSANKWDYEDEYAFFKVKEGQLWITSKETPYWNSWYMTTPQIQDFYLEMTFDMPTCSGSDRIGLIFRTASLEQFYFLGVRCDRKWGFEKLTKEIKIENILPYTQSDQLKPMDQKNRVGVLANDDTFEFYINGKKVGEVQDQSYQDAGSIGFISQLIETKGFTTRIDTLQYWELP